MLINTAQAAQALMSGHLIAYPTESSYGIGCDPFNERSVKAIIRLKKRDPNKGFLLVASSFQQVEPLINIDKVPKERLDVILKTWPGPITWVFPASLDVPSLITGDKKTIALRVSAHNTVRDICKKFGKPIVSTSANMEGESPIQTQLEMEKQFTTSIFFIVRGRVGRLGKPTPIYDAVTGEQLR